MQFLITGAAGFLGAALANRMAREGGIAEEEVAGPAAVPVYSEVQERGTAVAYTLAKKVSVKADASEHKLAISSQILKGNFEYSTYPRAVTRAYLGSRVKNAEGLQLLAGRVNIFLDGDYVGASTIPAVAPADLPPPDPPPPRCTPGPPARGR